MKYGVVCFCMMSFSFSFGAELLKEDSAYVMAFREYLARESESTIETNLIESFINQTKFQENLSCLTIPSGIKLEKLAFGTHIRVGVGPDKKIFYCWFANKPEEIAEHTLQDDNKITAIVAAQDNKTIGAIANSSWYNGNFGLFVCLSIFDVSRCKDEKINLKKL